jgi:hypothetical protein
MTNGMAGAADGWPVIPTRELVGAQIGHGQSNIIFGITGYIAGHGYSVAGLNIRYSCHGQIYNVIAWSAAVACVTKLITRRAMCPNAADRTQARVKKMAAESPGP